MMRGINLTSPLRLERRPSVLAGLAVALAVMYAVLPASAEVDFIRPFAAGASLVAILYGVAIHRPCRGLGWKLVAVATALQTAAALTWSMQFLSGNNLFPSIVDFLRLLGLLVLIGGLLVIRDDASNDDVPLGPIETTIVGIAAGVGVWLVVVESYVADGTLPFGDKVWAAAIPLLGAFALTIAVRLALQSNFRRASPALLASGISVWMLADVARSVLELRGDYGPGGFVASLSIIGPLWIGAAALDSTMAPRSSPVAGTLGFSRMVGVGVAALTPVAVLFLLMITGLGTRTTRMVVAGCALVVGLLALVRIWGLLAHVRRLTERRGQDRLAAMVEHSSDVVVLLDVDGNIRYASPGLSSTLGHRPIDWLTRSVLNLVAGADRAQAEQQLTELIELGPGATFKFEADLVRVDGQCRRMEATIANLIGGETVDGIVATFRDVTEQRDLEVQLSHLAFHDELTGLANRALLLERMEQALRTSRPDGDPVIVLFVDLDDFKSVNDQLGHDVGDQLLVHIAGEIRSVAGPGDTPARLGGDEFALLLEDVGGVDRAIGVAESLLDLLRKPLSLSGNDLSVLASVGMAEAAPGMTTSSLLRDADTAMYEAKRAGKGQIKIFDPALRLSATRHLETRRELRTEVD
jgi:diguanylate cyclase (GGDEF)-like protein/PAS domain S-box-containing protein